VVVSVLLDPLPHVGKTYELTGPRSQDLYALAGEYSTARGRSVTYFDVPVDDWRDQELRGRRLPEYVFEHLLTMAHLHAANRYVRLSAHVEAILGRPPRSLESMVRDNHKRFSAG
jgi:NAD(P)H dehydrogenase (quinone)